MRQGHCLTGLLTAKKGEKQTPETITKRMKSWKETRRKKGLPLSDDLGEAPFCACGCGQKVHKHPEQARWYKFINGHNRKGIKLTDEQRKKLSLQLKGIPKTITEKLIKSNKERGIRVRGTHVSWNSGLTKHDHPSLMNLSTKYKELFKDKTKCPSWQGGKSFESYGEEFSKELKNKIRERDGFKCRFCGKPEEKHSLNVHHIDYDKKNNNSYNLISLCVKCHCKTNYSRNFYKIICNYILKKETNYLINKFSQLSII